MSFLGMGLWMAMQLFVGSWLFAVILVTSHWCGPSVKGNIAEMSFSGMGSWTSVDMPPPSSVPLVNQTLKRADEV